MADESSREAVYVKSETFDGPVVKGYNFSKGLDYDALLQSYSTVGFQATSFGRVRALLN